MVNVGGLCSIIVNEIVGKDVYTIRFDVEPDKKAILYAIDTEKCDEKEIQVIDKKGKINPQITKIANKTILMFNKRSDIYSLSYVKENFISNSDGIFKYNETWRALPITLYVLALPEYSVLKSTNPKDIQVNCYQNKSILSMTKDTNFKVEIDYQIDSLTFLKYYNNMNELTTHENDISRFVKKQRHN